MELEDRNKILIRQVDVLHEEVRSLRKVQGRFDVVQISLYRVHYNETQVEKHRLHSRVT